jgi:hypothetical protein
MFAVAAMRRNARDALDSGRRRDLPPLRGRTIFPRAQYVRARSVPDAAVAGRTLSCGTLRAVLWLLSAFVEAPERLRSGPSPLSSISGSPWLAVRHNVKVPPDAAHFTGALWVVHAHLLGETMVAVMQGMESQEDWTPAAATRRS